MWVNDLELVKAFYENHFGASSNSKYSNRKKGFESYFLTFSSGCRMEIMKMDAIPECAHSPLEQHTGFIHIAFSLGSASAVDRLTAQLKMEGYCVLDGPRTTGDGYYESVVLDPEGNRVELTA